VKLKTVLPTLWNILYFSELEKNTPSVNQRYTFSVLFSALISDSDTILDPEKNAKVPPRKKTR
jgi:hypothetical protein